VRGLQKNFLVQTSANFANPANQPLEIRPQSRVNGSQFCPAGRPLIEQTAELAKHPSESHSHSKADVRLPTEGD
jgi:hypothetical protein